MKDAVPTELQRRGWFLEVMVARRVKQSLLTIEIVVYTISMLLSREVLSSNLIHFFAPIPRT